MFTHLRYPLPSWLRVHSMNDPLGNNSIPPTNTYLLASKTISILLHMLCCRLRQPLCQMLYIMAFSIVDTTKSRQKNLRKNIAKGNRGQSFMFQFLLFLCQFQRSLSLQHTNQNHVQGKNFL